MRWWFRTVGEHVFLTNSNSVGLTELSLIITHTGGVQTWSQQVQKYTGFNCISSKTAVELKLTLLEVDWTF